MSLSVSQWPTDAITWSLVPAGSWPVESGDTHHGVPSVEPPAGAEAAIQAAIDKWLEYAPGFTVTQVPDPGCAMLETCGGDVRVAWWPHTNGAAHAYFPDDDGVWPLAGDIHMSSHPDIRWSDCEVQECVRVLDLDMQHYLSHELGHALFGLPHLGEPEAFREIAVPFQEYLLETYPAPEPSSGLLMLVALAAVAWRRRR